MAQSTCPKCDNTRFEVKHAEPKNSNFVLAFIQCTSCGAVVGVMDYQNVGYHLQRQNEAIKQIAQKLQVSVDL